MACSGGKWLTVLTFTWGFCVQASPGAADIIQSGFNDATGINSDGVTNNSPFDTDNASLHGQGTGETGWAGPWVMSVGSAVVQSTAYEGDGAAAFFQNTAAADRTLAVAPTDLFTITFQLLLPAAPSRDVIFRVYDSGIASIFSKIAVQWSVESNLELRVLDGVEDSIDNGGTYSEATGIFLTPGVWHEMTTVIDPVSRTWNVAVDGLYHTPPDPLGFRGVPVNINSIQFLNEIASPNGSYIDAFVIDTEPTVVPEPSVIMLLAMGTLGWFGRRVLRRKPAN